METTNNNSKPQQENNPLKKWVIILGALAGLLLLTTLYVSFFAKPVTNKEYVKIETSNNELQNELNTLLAEHERIKAQYGDLAEQMTEKDSICYLPS